MKRNKEGYNRFLIEFIGHILIHCPECHQLAQVQNTSEPLMPVELNKVTLTCLNCGYNKYLSQASQQPAVTLGIPVDPYFGIPLFLIERLGDAELWAYNLPHLHFLSDFISTPLRERTNAPRYNSSLGSRLPGWMTSAGNRQKILAALHRLEGRLQQGL